MSGRHYPPGLPSTHKARYYPSNAGNNSTLQRVAAVYWDVNCMCHFEKIVGDSPSEEDLAHYQNMKVRVEDFVNKAVLEFLTAQANGGSLTRCGQLISEASWKIFAICAHSEAFRVASESLDGISWLPFRKLIKNSSRSLEVFARVRQLDWRGCLLPYAQYNLPGLEEELTPDVNIAQEHPHHTVLLADGHLRRPVYQNVAQTNIGSSIWNPLDFPGELEENPSIRTPTMGSCFLCKSPSICQCTLISLAGDLVELNEYPGKGVGIRSLAYFKKGEWIGEYPGMLGPAYGSFTESVYPLRLTAPDCEAGDTYLAAMVFAHRFGNWTRFMNHSCQSSVNFHYKVSGDKLMTWIQAARDISIFEELTINYGWAYWRTRPYLYCHCGAPNCYRPASKIIR